MNKFVVGLLLCVVASSVQAETRSAKKKVARKKLPAAYQPPEVQQGLPNVLLIGDSISIGYMLAARQQLSGEANVFRPATNCGPSSKGLESIDSWLGDRKWDVIHFNHGLHDLKYLGPNGENLAAPGSAGSHQQVPIEQYKTNLKKIAKRLKKTGAAIVWCETTPVPDGSKGRVPGDSKKYNDAAAEVMAELGGIETDSLYGVASKISDMQKPANVHYTAEGSKELAKQVAASVRNALKSR